MGVYEERPRYSYPYPETESRNSTKPYHYFSCNLHTAVSWRFISSGTWIVNTVGSSAKLVKLIDYSVCYHARKRSWIYLAIIACFIDRHASPSCK